MSRRDAIHAELHRHNEFAHRSPNHGLPCRIDLTSKPSSRSVGSPNVGNSTAVARPSKLVANEELDPALLGQRTGDATELGRTDQLNRRGIEHRVI